MRFEILPVKRCDFMIQGPPISAGPVPRGFVFVVEIEVHVLIKLRLFLSAHVKGSVLRHGVKRC
jgi:hypothetical protein